MRSSALLLLLIACKSAPSEAPADDEALPPAAVTCAPITQTAVDEVVEVDGVIAPPPKLDAVISSAVAGRLALVTVEEGDHVAAGQLLATIEDPALPAGSLEANAQVTSARAGNEAARLELARQQRLVDTGIGARRDLDDARAKAAAAAADVQVANARAGLASRQNARRDLRAPHAGIVLHVWKRTGESVDGTTANPVVEIADVTVLEVRAQVSPASLVKLKDGLAATVKVIGIEAPVAATVARVAPAVDPTTLLGTVRVQLAPGTQIPVGSAASARIVTSTHPGLVVPPTALRRSQLGSDEVVTCKGDVAKAVVVTIGQRTATSVEITSGLVAGDKIVVDHVLGLEDGQHLTAKPAAGTPP
ncbi:MAG: efflux RND transporter periplasmic adaptor subunit [Polyangiales bacterium]